MAALRASGASRWPLPEPLECWFVAALITECFRVGCLRRALQLRLSRGSKGSGSSYLEAPEALGAAISTLQRLEEHPSRGSRGSKSTHLEAPEARGAAIARLQRLWVQPSRGSRGSRSPSGSNLSFIEFSRLFSSLATSWGALPTAPGGSRRLPAASSWLKRASRWLRVASRALRSGLEASEAAWSGLKSARGASVPTRTRRNPSQANSKVLSTASSMD